jgi:hypothetical protein
MDETKWYRRLADVPSIGYVTPSDVDRRRLPKRDLEPRIDSHEIDGERHRSLWWKRDNVQTGQSPAAEWAQGEGGDPREVSSADLLRRLQEALELPGRPSDYHFAIMGAYEDLWLRRREEPDVLPELERLCLLDIGLLEAIPNIIRTVGNREVLPPLSAPAFSRLIYLYERNGLLEDALAIAKRGVALGQSGDDVERLSQRIASLLAEDAR